MIRLLIAMAFVAAAGFGPVAVSAELPLDGSAPLLCAVTEVQECEPGHVCQRQTPEAVYLPAFLRIDVRARRVGADDATGRMSPIHHVATVDGRLIMYGGQEGRSRSAVILGQTGKFSVSVVDHEGGSLIFGACTTT